MKADLMQSQNYALVAKGIIQAKGSKKEMLALKRTRLFREYFLDAVLVYTMKPLKAAWITQNPETLAIVKRLLGEK